MAPGLPPVRAEPVGVATYLLRLPTGDGKDTAGALVVSPGRPPRAGVVIVHGYGGNFSSGVPGHLAPPSPSGGSPPSL